MPYKSKAQAAYFHIHKKELEKQGVNVAEWDAATKAQDKKLPEHAPKKKETSEPKLREADLRARNKRK